MSEFECRNGHMMRPGRGGCPVCGENIYTMDGLTSRQLEQQEREEVRDSNPDIDNDEVADDGEEI